ncbi:SDR family oxidoreductase [Novosphingobium sp. CECT 9465]|uniref:SDR family oxidoreductase n=1 Tax=Novosphingobium sp. CECT 9465 TaxID=2829794 RepID=UPI001E3B9770|nr:SDR family oxidoreductase [Novosphingobium sp. CECT 9465]CAH0498211.1 hypothetical protein NVSP9465_03291 [Novosphingobium sp. CECT 9465]
MTLAADMGRHSGRATPFLHDGPYRQFETASGGRSTNLLPNPVQTKQATSHLLSDRSSCITGQAISVDGGFTAGFD